MAAQAISRLREAQEDRARLTQAQAEIEWLRGYVTKLETVSPCRASPGTWEIQASKH